ncbi:polyprenyl synthetase family protein [[Clostridium] colinum]|uniref:polyprenyl synthetase family protein n=1 Tax=[Clostridium] colinum TaxID=36835 RepID=UPI002024DA67|nr:farnesyl diphosphate synthase [[Clostridium] colinum]
MDNIEMRKHIFDIINQNILKYLNIYASKEMYLPMEYSLKVGGKRFRPMLMLLTCDAFSKNYEDAIPFAVAMECIHTYSLIHDDLPAMDNDDLRRGFPTCHIKFDEATAILTGDGLLNIAFEIMIDKLKNNFEKKYLDAIQCIANASGTNGMIKGQALDIKAEGKKINKNELFDIYENKTGKLILASMKVGAIIGGANEEQIKLVEQIAYNLGIAFQIQDDILDIEGDQQKIGKPINSDIKNDKCTYVSIYGSEKAKKDYILLSSQALEGLEKLGFGEKQIYFYIKNLINRDN